MRRCGSPFGSRRNRCSPSSCEARGHKGGGPSASVTGQNAALRPHRRARQVVRNAAAYRSRKSRLRMFGAASGPLGARTRLPGRMLQTSQPSDRVLRTAANDGQRCTRIVSIRRGSGTARATAHGARNEPPGAFHRRARRHCFSMTRFQRLSVLSLRSRDELPSAGCRAPLQRRLRGRDTGPRRRAEPPPMVSAKQRVYFRIMTGRVTYSFAEDFIGIFTW